MRLLTAAFLAVFLVSNSLAVREKSWPEFRGPTGQGHSAAKGLPSAFGEDQNVRWKTAIPGEGWSSPVILDGRVWMTTATEGGKSLRAVSVDFQSGRLLVDREVFAVESPRFKHMLNSYASPTPVIETGRVYVSFGDYGNACLNSETGEVIWKNQDLRLEHENGPGSSPILYKDSYILHCDGTNVQYMAALNKADGKIKWKVDRSGKINKSPEMKKAYSVPLIINVDGKDQLISAAAEHLYAYDPSTGKELWFVKYPGFSNVPRPVFANGLIYACTGYGKPELWAVKPGSSGESGDLTSTHVQWKHLRQAPAKPSPLVVEDILYMVSDNGVATALEASTGQELWQERIGGEYSASPIYADGRLWFFGQDGGVRVLKPGRQFQLLANNKLQSGFMASPAVYEKALVLRTKTHLYRVEEGGAQK
ncbi:MAG TPA: PQQ-binding-like beta-propeller repeat protein [Methylomirabilota bacterium]|nr:PQQ-binding-like beta-propeller repeat protein [Methylomirabilota bacterium]